MNRTTLLAAAALATAAGSASAQFWTIDASFGLSQGISDNGIVTGDSLTGGPYFLWNQTSGATTIGGASAGQGVGGQPKISNDGAYVAGTRFNAAGGYYEMGRYTVATGTWEGFGTFAGYGTQIDQSVSSGYNISGDGRSVVGLGWTSLGTADTHAMQWTEGTGVIDLGTATTGESARANAVDFDGNVVAGWQDGAGRQGSVWVDGVQTLIFKDDGGIAQEAFAVSDDGRYVTGLGLGSFFAAGHAYRYDTLTDTYLELTNIAGGESRMAGAAINGDGSLIGGGTWGLGPATFGTALMWTEDEGTMTLTDYLDMNSIAYDASFNFAFVSDISSDGQWITGWGNYGTPASTQSFVIQVPAPSSMAFIAMGSLVAARRRR